MLKLLDFDPVFFDEQPSVSIIDVKNSKGGFVKSAAADDRIQNFAKDIKPEADKIYVHILAMGSGEYFGANRNGDYFPEENLKKYHETFFTSPAHIFKHHVNKNPEIAIGKVIFSVYNERMHRVEVIAWVDKNKGYDYVQKIEKGMFPSTSMACHTPYDTCSVCGNRARSRQEYCDHLKTQLGRVMPNGVKVMAINDGPLKFFDMSFVFKPADITSSVMQKVAFAESQVLSSAENAELHGLVEKSAQIKKLSELIKEIEGQVIGSSDSMAAILDRVKDPDEEVIKTLVKFDLHHVIHALAELGISPSIGFFAKLVGQKIAGESVSGIEHLVQGLIKEDSGSLEVPELDMEKGASDFQVKFASEALLPFQREASLLPHHVIDRTLSGSIAIPSNGMGYTGNGPTPIEDPRNTYKFLRQHAQDNEPGLLKTLFLIGGAAVAAKWLLSKIIESKMQEHVNQMNNKPVKIVLVKSASEAITTTKLVKAAFLRDLT
jgi:hypothetical protein